MFNTYELTLQLIIKYHTIVESPQTIEQNEHIWYQCSSDCQYFFQRNKKDTQKCKLFDKSLDKNKTMLDECKRLCTMANSVDVTNEY